MSFASSGRNKGLENDKTSRDSDPQGRFNNLRNRSGDLDGDRFREGRNANPLRRRGESTDQDSEGWSTVKPRKSFGAEGAERFHGRMGGNFRDEKRPSRDDRLGRSFDTFARDGDEDARSRNNGLGKGKPDPWHKAEATEARVPEKRERIDRAKSWREREPEPDAPEDHGATRYENKRWGREQRVEREPEWFDEPAEPKVEGRTQQDFQKWMEEMKKSKSGQPAATQPAAMPASESSAESAKPPMRSPPPAEAGPDKFFMAFGSTTGVDVASPNEQPDATRPKPAAKSSRFTSFFQSHDGGKHEQAMPMGPPPPQQPQSMGGLAALLGAAGPALGANPPDEEKQAFQQLLAKLQKQSVSATPPGPSPFAAPAPNNGSEGSRQNVGPSPFQYSPRDDRHDGPMPRPPPQHAQEILAPRPQQQSARPEQLLQDLVGHHQRVSSQGSGRADAPHAVRSSSNTEFLMNLMRPASDSQRSDSAMMRAAQQAQKQIPPMVHPIEREAEFSQESRHAQRHMRPPPPPGFPMEEAFRGGEADIGHSRPTQILQRPPPPPGLDQMPPGWMGGGQMPPPPPQQQQQPQHQPQQPQHQRGPMLPPPPGLPGGLGRNGHNGHSGPMPHMFPPNIPPMPHPEAMGNMPPRNMGPPPPGFFNGPPPPHGFIPPGMGGFNGPPGPESFVGSPFEARGMPPSAGGRGANFGRG